MRKISFLLVMGLVLIAFQAVASNRLELNKGWQFRQQNIGNWLPATVPGTVHTDLLSNKLIEDPFYGDRQKDLQWIDKVNWEYRCLFDASEAFRKDNVRLVFNGIDCFSEVWLNGNQILVTENMFRTWKADVRKFIKATGNELRIVLESPTKRGYELMTEYGVQLQANNDLNILGGMGPKNKVSVFTRKSGYQYGWDLTPRYVTSGIWRPVYLESWNEAYIEDFYVYTKSLTKRNAEIGTVLSTAVSQAGDYKISLTLGGKCVKEFNRKLEVGENTIEAYFDIRSPRLWYPRSMGEPYLYEVGVVLEYAGKRVDSREVKTGVRTTELVYEKDKWGRSFYMKINGVPVFCKGSNYVPADSFLPRVSKDMLEHIVKSAADANMNMLRVWGGGTYEDDYFYELCDKYGIMVWQDFIFACNMYPGGEGFLSNVKFEAIDNVKRIRNHPSVVIWCGNNEIDVAWKPYNKPESRFRKFFTEEQSKAFDKANETIFMNILPTVIKESYKDPIPYWHSSPSPGWTLDTLDRWSNGDVHNWDVWHKGVPINDYNELIARFSTEYGLQSYPEYSSILEYVPEKELYIGSPTMTSHQGDRKGDKRIAEYIGEFYRVPENFKDLTYLSLLMQAEGIKIAVEAHRRNMPYSMGSLIWQHNDTWPCTSWAGIDYYGRWKAMNYYMVRAFDNVLVAPYLHGDTLDIFVVSDLYKPIRGKMELSLCDFTGKSLKNIKESISVGAITSKKIATYQIATLLEGYDKGNVVLHCSLRTDEGEYEALLYFDKMKNIILPSPKVKIDVEKKEDDSYLVTVSTDVLAKNLTLYYKGIAGIFSDNYFDLLPGKIKTVSLKTNAEKEDVLKDLTWFTLNQVE